MPDKHDYYQTLGVARGASETELKSAYRNLARKLHPDVNKEPDAESRFKELSEAYAVLSDPQKRQAYDQYGHGGLRGGRGGAAGAQGFPFDMGDILNQFFGGGAPGGRPGATRGADLRTTLDLAFDEAVFGCEKVLEVTRWENCLICDGSGAEPGKAPSRCAPCNGTGEVRRVQQSIFGQFVNVAACERCRGTGQVVTHRCVDCGGRGSVRKVRSLTVTVPAGVDSDMEIRLSDQADRGERGGPSGDLYVRLRVKAHPKLRRDGADLIYELPLDVAQASLGAEVQIPTLAGEEAFRVPAGTQPGHVFSLRDRGAPRLQRSGRGVLRLVTRIDIPSRLTERQRELMAQLAETFKPVPPAVATTPRVAPDKEAAGAARDKASKGILDKMKDALGLDSDDH